MKKYEQYPLHIQNSLSREKEKFEAINPPHVGLYVCGPTVYSDVHLGNCRTFVSFDVIYRYLTHLDYQVRYVRNITDVGHLLDDGEDRMAKRAKVEQLEPMEVAQKYTNGFRKVMQIFNTLPPSIEPQASGHIPEQIEMVQSIIDNFNAKGYKIPSLLNKPYDEGMNMVATMEPDENLDEGEEYIKRVIKPQVNYNGKMIQAAEVVVAFGE